MRLKYLLGLLTAAVSLSAGAADDGVVNPDSTGFTFTDVKVVKCTSVKDQNKSGTCWCFSANSFLENELLRITGKEYDLSEMYIVRKCYEEKAKKFIRMYGEINFAEGGSFLDVPYIMSHYGAMPEEAYPGLEYGDEKHNHKELSKALTAYIKAIVTVPNKKLSKSWFAGYMGILDAYFGKVPDTFKHNGKTYTARSFEESLGLNLDDYMAFTSFTHHPFYHPFAIEVADNWIWGTHENVKLDELQKIVENAIDKGYSVGWAADVSEVGFKWRKGYAVLPKARDEKDFDGTELSKWVKVSDSERENMKFKITGPCEELNVTQELRQEMFDNQETTDDHGMVIVGSAVDQKGNKYYKVKNSWDTNQVYGGYFYVSVPYFLAKTIGVYVHRDAVPSAILAKLK
ncbi:MAG: aminopeptidase C [Muribaculaceae bacterium]